MPELPEVEHVRRLMESVLVGQRITQVDVRDDSIVYKGTPREAVQEALHDRQVKAVGRKGKYWWIELDRAPWLVGHLGMNGWIYEWGTSPMRLHSHGKAPLDHEDGEPRFLKLSLTTENERKVAVTDSRRLARMWLCDDLSRDPTIQKLGPDAWGELPKGKTFAEMFRKRGAPIKALLLNQEIISGIGNWIADEVLYHARIAPMRVANTLSDKELSELRKAIEKVIAFAVEVDADYQKFPEEWMFNHRWGGAKGTQTISGREIRREAVGGRTTAWVPGWQR